ncbi:MAG: hypothetical protein GX102_07400 [Porphyromonadaceae bacterium]|nr:hypothetical protein [Porphyromonadaceae bacterium]
MRPIEIALILISGVWIACSSTTIKNKSEKSDCPQPTGIWRGESVEEERHISSSDSNNNEEDNPLEVEILSYTVNELKQRLGKAQPENIKDLFLLLPDDLAFGFSLDERKQMLDGEKVGGGVEMGIGDLDLKNHYLNFQGNYTGNWEMCTNRKDDFWLFAVNYHECGQYCSTQYAKMLSYENGVIKELRYANLAGYQDLWPELFFDFSKLTDEQTEFVKEEWDKFNSEDFETHILFNLPRDGKIITMYIDQLFFEEMLLPYEAFKSVENELWD